MRKPPEQEEKAGGFNEGFFPPKVLDARRKNIAEHILYCEKCKRLSKVWRPEYSAWGTYMFYQQAGILCLYFLCRYILYPYKQPLMTHNTHLEYCNFIWHWDFKSNFQQMKIAEMPRNSFKTGIGSIGYSIQQILYNPNIKIMVASAKLGLALDILSTIKQHFSGNSLLRQHYFDFVPSLKERNRLWRENAIRVKTPEYAFICSPRNPKVRKKLFPDIDVTPTVFVCSVDSPRVGYHPDLGIYDDLHDEKNTKNKESIEGVVEFFKLTKAVLKPTGRALVQGTPWAEYDVIADALKSNKNVPYFHRSAYNDDKSLFFPEVLNEEFLRDRRKELGEYFFGLQYLCLRTAPQRQRFKKEWFKQWEKLPETLDIVTAVDPATGEGKDATAIVTVGYHRETRKLYTLETKELFCNETEVIKQLADTIIRWSPRRAGMETVAFAKTYKNVVSRALKEMGILTHIESLVPDTRESKKRRIARLIPLYEWGDILHHADCEKLETELIWFREESDAFSDNIIDAFSYTLDLLNIAVKSLPAGYTESLHTPSFKTQLKQAGRERFLNWKENRGQAENLYMLPIKQSHLHGKYRIPGSKKAYFK